MFTSSSRSEEKLPSCIFSRTPTKSVWRNYHVLILWLTIFRYMFVSTSRFEETLPNHIFSGTLRKIYEDMTMLILWLTIFGYMFTSTSRSEETPPNYILSGTWTENPPYYNEHMCNFNTKSQNTWFLDIAFATGYILMACQYWFPLYLVPLAVAPNSVSNPSPPTSGGPPRGSWPDRRVLKMVPKKGPEMVLNEIPKSLQSGPNIINSVFRR